MSRIKILKSQEELERIQKLVENKGFTVLSRERTNNYIILDLKESINEGKRKIINDAIIAMDNEKVIIL